MRYATTIGQTHLSGCAENLSHHDAEVFLAHWPSGTCAIHHGVQPICAQRLPANYNLITYRKVAPENVEAFLHHTRTETKKVIQARLDSGAITGWSVLKLTAPTR